MTSGNDEKTLIAENDIVLESADPLQAEHSPILRVVIAVCWTGVLAGVMGAFAAAFAVVSAGKGGERFWWSICFALLCGVTLFFLSLFDRKKQKEFEKKEKESMDKAVVYKGTITAAEKHVKKIAYANQIFEEITWQFIAEYKNENNNTVTVKSGRYVNDISKALKSTQAEIYIKGNGESVVKGLQPAHKGDTITVLDTIVIEEG